MNSQHSQRSPDTSIRWAVFVVGFFAFLQVYCIQAILPVLMVDLQATAVQIGISVGMTVMAIALISPFIGMVSDIFGRKVIILTALGLLAVPTALVGISQTVYQLNIWRFLQGLSIPGMTVVLIAYISEECEDIAKMTAMYVAGTVLGGFSGRFLLGYLHELIGWRYAFGLMAIATLVGALSVAYLLPASSHFVKNSNLTAAFLTLKSHSHNKDVLSACALGACVLFSLVGCFTFINLHLANMPYVLSTKALANIFLVYLIGMVVTPLSAKLIGWLGLYHAISWAIGVSFVGLLLTLALPLWLIVVGLTLMCTGVFITQTATISHIGANVKQGRSLASGLYYMCYYAGGSLGAWACAIAYSHYHWAGVVALIVLLQGIGLVIVHCFMKSD